MRVHSCDLRVHYSSFPSYGKVLLLFRFDFCNLNNHVYGSCYFSFFPPLLLLLFLLLLLASFSCWFVYKINLYKHCSRMFMQFSSILPTFSLWKMSCQQYWGMWLFIDITIHNWRLYLKIKTNCSLFSLYTWHRISFHIYPLWSGFPIFSFFFSISLMRILLFKKGGKRSYLTHAVVTYDLRVFVSPLFFSTLICSILAIGLFLVVLLFVFNMAAVLIAQYF